MRAYKVLKVVELIRYIGLVALCILVILISRGFFEIFKNLILEAYCGK